MLTIDIAIVTYRDRIGMVEKMLLPPVEGVRYVVSWQDHEDRPLPEGIVGRLSGECGGDRGDVEVYRFDQKGVSRNRNNAIDHCRSDLVIMSDDDLVYTKEGIENIGEAFRERKEMDLAVFRVKFPVAKPYPAADCLLGLPFPKGYWVSMIEVAFGRERIGDLRFHPELGLGAEYFQSGEDEMFVISAIKRGLNCWFIDRLLCSHPTLSTGYKATPGILRGRGVIMGVIYPGSGIMRIPLKAWRLSRAGKTGFFKAIRHLTEGFIFRDRILDSPCFPRSPVAKNLQLIISKIAENIW